MAPPEVDRLRRVLKGEALLCPSQALQIERSLPQGHVAAALVTLRRIGLESDLARSACPERDLACALIVARILCPASKLATARGLHKQAASSSLGALLGLELLDEDHLYATMDWLLPRQARIEEKLAARHLQPATVVLYDVTSTYFEGRRCPLAQYGCSREERPGNLQIVFGLLTNPEGCPVAVEVFEGHTADPKAVAEQIRKLRQRVELQQVVVVGDRGMLTSARIREDLAEIQHPAYPGERLIACRNPLLAEERKRKRESWFTATEKQLEKIRAATQRQRRPLRGKKEIGLAGKVLGPLQNGEALAVDHRGGSLRRSGDWAQHRRRPRFQVLNLGSSPSFQLAFTSPSGRISEDLLIDPIRNLPLSGAENNNYEIVNLTTSTSPAFFEHATGSVGVLDSAGEDCTDRDRLAPAEFSSPSSV